MKYFLILVLLISCQSPTPRVFVGDRCQTFFVFDDAKRIILEESFCRCVNYKISMELIGSTGQGVVRHPIEYCHGNIGYSVEETLNQVTFFNNVRDDIRDSKNKKREKTNY